ncbi:MAG: dihydropteroate synthase [Saprospiraceae bacterium]
MDQIAPLNTLNCRGRIIDLDRPLVMGILNTTPDSFYDGGRYADTDAALRQAERMLREGAAIIDVGGASSRPGADETPPDEELRRVLPVVERLAREFPDAILSVDTWRASVAEAAIEAGAGMLNDISGGAFDPDLWPLIGRINRPQKEGGRGLSVPYVLMHIQGHPKTMQIQPRYTDLLTETTDYFLGKIAALRALGVSDIVIDPGFGFGKTLEHNYELLRYLPLFAVHTQLPVLVGVSRKSMICRLLGVAPEQALNGATALHMYALMQGAAILRAHDVKQAIETILCFEAASGKARLSDR